VDNHVFLLYFYIELIKNIYYEKFKRIDFGCTINTVTAFGKTTGILDVPVKQISSQVAELFKNPDFAVEKEMIVNVIFTFNEEGKIVVLHIASKDKEVKNYVRRTLKNKSIYTPGEVDRIFKIPVSIKRW
jgi:hypothetical protein